MSVASMTLPCPSLCTFTLHTYTISFFFFHFFKMRVLINRCIKFIKRFHPVSVCINSGEAGRCCWLYCSCLASWGHAFLRVSRVWLQPPHTAYCHSGPLLSSQQSCIHIWVMQLEAFAQSFCSLFFWQQCKVKKYCTDSLLNSCVKF